MKLSDQTARDLMTQDVARISAEATLLEATRAMRDRELRCLIVAPSKPGHGVGILTTKDIITALHDEEPDALANTTVEDVMTKPAICAQATLCIPDCIDLMRMTGVRRLPILDGDSMIGLLSYTDVFRFVAQQAGRE